MEIIDYVKKNSKEDKGAIMIDVYGSEKAYIAVTISTIKTYKTLKGAEKMMELSGYEKGKKSKKSKKSKIMKQNQGELSEAELKARRRFWNKRGFFGEPDKKAIERDSMKMQRLVKALKTFSPERVKKIRAAKYPGTLFTDDMYAVWRASESDINHAISTFKIF